MLVLAIKAEIGPLLGGTLNGLDATPQRDSVAVCLSAIPGFSGAVGVRDERSSAAERAREGGPGSVTERARRRAEGWALDARDLALLEAACQAADRVEVLEAAVDEDGLMILGSTGQEVLHPAVSEARLQRQLMSSLLGKVELAPPLPRTGHLSGKQRNQLADARRRRWGGGHG